MNFVESEDQKLYIEQIFEYYNNKELTEGQLLQLLRKEILELNQTDFSELVGISRRTLSDLEQDNGKPTITVLNAVFSPFGLKVGLVKAN